METRPLIGNSVIIRPNQHGNPSSARPESSIGMLNPGGRSTWGRLHFGRNVAIRRASGQDVHHSNRPGPRGPARHCDRHRTSRLWSSATALHAPRHPSPGGRRACQSFENGGIAGGPPEAAARCSSRGFRVSDGRRWCCHKGDRTPIEDAICQTIGPIPLYRYPRRTARAS